MFQAFGRTIPVTTAELLREPVALVVWDMQEGIARPATNFETLTANIPRLAAAARRRGSPVVYSQHFSVPIEHEDRPNLRTLWQRAGEDASRLKSVFPAGSPGWQFTPETAPIESDVVLAKRRASFFEGTAFRALLAGSNIDVIVLTGVATDRGILSTAREAAFRGLFTVVVSDAVASHSDSAQEQGLKDLAAISSICTTDEVLAAWTT
jgi:nicotinamidase-related amidase